MAVLRPHLALTGLGASNHAGIQVAATADVLAAESAACGCGQTGCGCAAVGAADACCA